MKNADRYSFNDNGDDSRRLPSVESTDRNKSKINLTGDNQIDADITAFMNARKRIINQMKRKFFLNFTRIEMIEMNI